MNPLFLVFELLIGVLFARCLRRAWRRGPHVAWQLLLGVVFGLLLEWGAIRQLDTYTYGHFALMLGPVPVAIGVAWGVIVYSSRLFSDSTTLPIRARPVLDGLLALTIARSMVSASPSGCMWPTSLAGCAPTACTGDDPQCKQ